MKKFLFGVVLNLSGFIGFLCLVIISLLKPEFYNGEFGFKAFLVKTEAISFFIAFCILYIVGIIICSVEAYFKK